MFGTTKSLIMARLPQSILGPIRGKIGPVIGSSWKGIPYLKAAHKTRTKSISDKEKANRQKFALAHTWLRPLLHFVRHGFKAYTPTVEGFVAAKSWLLKHAMEVTETGLRVNPSRMQVSHGDLPLPGNIAVELKAPGELQFSWDTAYVSDGNSCDQVMLLAYNVEKEQAFYVLTGEFRYKGADILKVPVGTGTYELYLSFTAHDRSRQSHSVYLGQISL